MTKRVRSEPRPLDVRPSTIMGTDAPDDRSRYEEVSRHLAQEIPQMAWGLGQQPRVPWLLSARNAALRGNETGGSADDDNGAKATDSSSAECESDSESEFATSADQNPSMYDDDAYFDALYIAMATSASSPGEQTRSPASSTPPKPDLNHSCDLEAMALRLLWQNQIHELRYRHATQSRDQEQARPREHSLTLPVERREPRQSDIVGDERLNRIMSDLRKLGTQLREDARKQLDVINDDNAALPLCL
ncbi:hypothetical protein TgHK011_000920 [Trichoderma gracile]|nr:hypothetical protein TgHK011_000920 [Trichoderma gracile]